MKVTARVRRSGGWWAVDVPEVDGVFTQAKRLDQVVEQTADAVAVMLDANPADVEVTIDAARVLDAAIEAQVEQARALAEQAEQTQREASAAMRAAVESLRGKVRLSVRDAGALLGVSHQRVGQLEAKASPAKQTAAKQRRSRSRRAE